MTDLEPMVDAGAREHAFAGVVRVDVDGDVQLAKAYGLADRARGFANTVGTRIATASGAKGFTALTVMCLVEDGVLSLATPARSLLGDDLPLIGADVTVEQLLAHRSGIGDYLDEGLDLSMTEYVMPVPVHRLATPEDYVRVLDGHPTAFAAGERFAYCNGGYVVLALLAERAAKTSYYDLVERLVCAPAGLTHTAFLRSDELPGDAALGYLAADGLRSNVLHLPVRGVGDGGIYSTAADVHALWRALDEGRIISPDAVKRMTRAVSVADDGRRYGLGFWLHPTGEGVVLEGHDAGASFRTVHRSQARVTYSVLANWTDGAWPIARLLEEWVERTTTARSPR